MALRIQRAAAMRLDEIYVYSREHFGEAQAEAYISGLFAAFERLGDGDGASRPIPAELGVTGYFFRYQRHIIYWKRLDNGDIGIVTILHERMHRIGRLTADFGLSPESTSPR